MNLGQITAGMGMFLLYIVLKGVCVVVATKKSRQLAGWLKVVITVAMAVVIGVTTEISGYSINFWLMLMFICMALRDTYYTVVVRTKKSPGIVYFVGWLIPVTGIWTYVAIGYMGVWFGGLLVLVLEALESDTYRSKSFVSIALLESLVLAVVAMLNGMGEAAVFSLVYFVVSVYCYVVSGVLQEAVEAKQSEMQVKGNRAARRSQSKAAKKSGKTTKR